MGKRLFIRFLPVVGACALSVLTPGCGTTPAIAPSGHKALDLQNYKSVLVSDFGDKVTPAGTDNKHQDSRDRIRSAGRTFADLLASEIRKTQAFPEVAREGSPAAPRLLISGHITRYDRGDVTYRRLIGLGVGSAYFDAQVELKDGETSELLGTVTVDRSSSVLGGDFAADQTPESFMEQAARRIATEVKQIRRGTTVTKK